MNLILRERENWLDNYFRPFFGEQEYYNYSVPTEVAEDEKNFVVKADLPGLEEKDVKVEYNHGVLSITGERKEEKKEGKGEYLRSEVNYGKFSRSFRFSDEIKESDISARFKNGVLEVTLPKKEEKKPRLIPLH